MIKCSRKFYAKWPDQEKGMLQNNSRFKTWPLFPANADLMMRIRGADYIGAGHICRCRIHDCIRALSHENILDIGTGPYMGDPFPLANFLYGTLLEDSLMILPNQNYILFLTS